ncbi:hypothetical protein [Nostoc sp.]|uniref:hypothetical protein n=1 Tax=Nostoc sp. TaxID=1180 RepID=UPI002FFB3B55
MSDVQRQAASLRNSQKAATSNFSNPSFLSATTPTLANPTRGFGVTNNFPIETATEVSKDFHEAQSLEPEVVQAKPFSHDISRISLFNPQAKRQLATNWVADRGEEIIPEILQRQSVGYEQGDISTIQRDETPSLPPVPNYQLTPPSLLQPPDPTSRYKLGMDMHLQLDPQLQAMVMQHVEQQLNPETIRPALNQINLGVLPTSGTASPSIPNPFASPTLPAAAPTVPAGAGPSTARTATGGDLLRAIIAVPAIDSALTSLKTQAGDRFQQDWRRLSTGGQIGVVSATALIGVGALAGVLSDPNARRLALDQLNGQTLPVPGLKWFRLEINTAGDNLMLGMHVDVGRLLPPSLGFGSSSPSAIGGPPQPQPGVSGQP